MSQQQPRRPGDQPVEPIKYGDVFPHVEGDLAHKPVMPEDAAAMQSAETALLGKTLQGGAAAAIQSAAAQNEMAGLVGCGNDTGNVVADDVSMTETDMSRRRVITELAGRQVVTQHGERVPIASLSTLNPHEEGGGGITIGEALEATAISAGEKPVEWSDAAAIQAAEVRATGRMNIAPGGVAATAQSAATMNARVTKDEDKTKLADVLKDARSKLSADRPATRRDAEGVAGAEMRNDPFLTTHPTGVAASVAAAARLNQNNK
ncbi:late embryogenesis abundant protein 47-like [Benincasa hispida]|uniref:late embryogenesis abundant protein 47-like n=1 Tax=Benincasa hispida TaxID=102211 RepID=UPI00190283F2|nr:late embryogenesis abundant protein 47-like [Benincasa hispida]